MQHIRFAESNITAFEKYNNDSNKNYTIVQRIIIDDCKNTQAAIEMVKKYIPKYYLIFSGDTELEKTQGIGKDDRIGRAIDATQFCSNTVDYKLVR